MSRGTEPGYRRERKAYRLVFEQYPGLVVRTRSCSTETFLKITELEGQEITIDVAREQLHLFAEHLLSWNLLDEETGLPVPATPEAVLAEDFDFVTELQLAWVEAVAGVSAPLAQPSSGGSPSLVESLPMDVASPSRAS